MIAAVDGMTAGGGFELALSCAFLVAGDGARFVMPEAKVGLVPGSGGSSRLVRYVGLVRANELVMLGGTLRGPRAEQIGLVTEVVETGGALAAARAMAGRPGAVAPPLPSAWRSLCSTPAPTSMPKQTGGLSASARVC